MKEFDSWYCDSWLKSLENIIPKKRLNEAVTFSKDHHITSKHIINNRFICCIADNQVEIKFRKFTEKEKRTINFYKYNKKYSTDIKENIFTQDFYDILSSKKINLFPTSIMDINLDCNCNNQKKICKHITTVLYLLSYELEKNPFIFFTLKGINITDTPYEFKQENISNKNKRLAKKENKRYEKEDNISDNTDKTISQQEKRTDTTKEIADAPEENDILESIRNIEDIFTRDILSEITVTENIFIPNIPNFNKVIISLMDENRENDKYTTILKEAYKSMNEYYMNKISNYNLTKDNKYNEFHRFKEINQNRNITTIFNNKWGYPNKWNTVSFNINNNYSISKITVGTDSIFTKYKKPLYLFAFLSELKQIEIPNMTREIYFFKSLYDFSLELIKKQAFIPELFKSNDKLQIRWIPPYSNSSINKIIENLSLTCPEEFITVNRKKIDRKNQVLIATSLIIKGFIENYISQYNDKNLDKYRKLLVFKLLFINPQKINLFKDEEYKHINKWLKSLEVKQSKYKLHIIISEYEDKFKIELKISIEENEEIPICNIEKNDESLFNRVNKDLKTITSISYLLDRLRKDEYIIISQEEFASFFNKKLSLLESIGLDISLPSFMNKKIHPKIELNIKNIQTNKTYLSLDNLMEFDWQVAVGNNKCNLDEFKKLTSDYNNLIKISDNYILLDSEDMKYLDKQIKKIPSKMTSYDIIKVIVTGQINDINVNINNNLKKMITNPSIEKTTLPSNINADLREYQKVGFNWLLQNIKTGFGSILADDMGLGKTLQVLSLIQYLKNEGFIDENPVLVVAPTSVLSNWKKEIEKFTPDLSYYIFHGTHRRLSDEYDIILTSYGIIREDYDLIEKKKWLLIVLDEAQNIKNPNSQQTRAVKRLNSKYKIALTGTPIENRLSEYWSIFDFVNHGYLYSIREFRKRFVNPIEKERDDKKLENLKIITQPFVLRRLKSDENIINDLPEKISNDLYCNLTANQAALYEKTLNTYMNTINEYEGIERKGRILKLINSLKQICNHPAQYTKSNIVDLEDSGKMQLLINTLENIIDNDEKVLIFTQYVQMGKILEKVLEDKFKEEVLFLHGSLNRKQKDEMIDKFQDDDNNHIFILSLKTGGTGVNLTSASNVIHYDLWWNPAVENQATDRAYRIGQTRNVMVYRFITTGTFEERINDMIFDKLELADITIGNSGKFITEMSDDNIKELLKLR